jgi:hypothetical protein
MKSALILSMFLFSNLFAASGKAEIACKTIAAQDASRAFLGRNEEFVNEPISQEIDKAQALVLIRDLDQQVYRGMYTADTNEASAQQKFFEVTFKVRAPGLRDGDPDMVKEKRVVTMRNADCTREYLLLTSTTIQK